jgi:hypothetical protein
MSSSSATEHRRTKVRAVVAICAVATLATSTPASAQERPDTAERRTSTFWLSASWHSGFPTRLGTRAYRDFYMFGFRRSWQVASTRRIAVDYMIDAIPLAVTTRVVDYKSVPGPSCADACTGEPQQQYAPTWHTGLGVGITPVGAQVRFFQRSAVQGIIGVGGGLIWFSRPVPDPSATQLNFTAQAGVGILIRVARDQRLMVGYQLHHASNGGMGRVNPGIDSRMVVLGLTRDLRRPR